jgi:hypothetical protein
VEADQTPAVGAAQVDRGLAVDLFTNEGLVVGGAAQVDQVLGAEGDWASQSEQGSGMQVTSAGADTAVAHQWMVHFKISVPG